MSGEAGTGPDYLLIVTAIYTAATIVIAHISWYFGSRQSRMQKQAMIIQEMGEVDEMINDDTTLLYRKIVLNHVTGTEVHGNFEDVAEKASGRMDRICARVSIDDDLLQKYLYLHAEKTGKLWMALQGYVIEERDEHHRDDPEFREFFEKVGKEAVAHYNRMHTTPLALKKKPKA